MVGWNIIVRRNGWAASQHMTGWKDSPRRCFAPFAFFPVHGTVDGEGFPHARGGFGSEPKPYHPITAPTRPNTIPPPGVARPVAELGFFLARPRGFFVLNFATGANKYRAGYKLQVINHLQITMHYFQSFLKQPNNTPRRKCHFIFATFPRRLFGVPKKIQRYVLCDQHVS